MTGNQIKGKGFRGALRYNLEKVEKGVAEVLDHSFVSVSEKFIMKEVQMVKVLRPNLQKYFYHTSINFPPDENISNNMMKAIGHDYLIENGFTQHQFIMFRHQDAGHPHLHILVNRIGYDGKVLSDSNDFARSEKVLRELEAKYNLTKVKSSKQASERAMSKNELEMMKRTNSPSGRLKLQVLVRGVLDSIDQMNIGVFVKALESKGVNVLFNQASTGYVSGISYSYDGYVIKGAKLGNDFKWTSIKNKLDYEQERDRPTIHQANVRTTFLDFNTGTNHVNNRGDQKSLQQFGIKDKTSAQRHKHSGADTENATGQSRTTKRKSGGAQHENLRHNNSFPEKSKGLNLASLLDGHSHGNIVNADHQSDLDPETALRLKRKKKHRKRIN